MPRRSAASLSVVPTALPRRPQAPAELTREQAKLWAAIVAEMPADFFNVGSWPLLVAYCRYADTADVLAQAINAFDRADLATDEGLDRYGKLLGMACRESAVLTSLAGKMRLSQSNRYDSKKRIGTSSSGPKPWEMHV
jgi:hypothetical protein